MDDHNPAVQGSQLLELISHHEPWKQLTLAFMHWQCTCWSTTNKENPSSHSQARLFWCTWSELTNDNSSGWNWNPDPVAASSQVSGWTTVTSMTVRRLDGLCLLEFQFYINKSTWNMAHPLDHNSPLIIILFFADLCWLDCWFDYIDHNTWVHDYDNHPSIPSCYVSSKAVTVYVYMLMIYQN